MQDAMHKVVVAQRFPAEVEFAFFSLDTKIQNQQLLKETKTLSEPAFVLRLHSLYAFPSLVLPMCTQCIEHQRCYSK